jgi:hypothetical protein
MASLVLAREPSTGAPEESFAQRASCVIHASPNRVIRPLRGWLHSQATRVSATTGEQLLQHTTWLQPIFLLQSTSGPSVGAAMNAQRFANRCDLRSFHIPIHRWFYKL